MTGTGVRKEQRLTGTEFAVKLFASHLLQVGDDKRPQVQDVVTRVAVPLLDHEDMRSTQQLQLDRRPQATRPAADHQTALLFQYVVVAARLTDLSLQSRMLAGPCAGRAAASRLVVNSIARFSINFPENTLRFPILRLLVTAGQSFFERRIEFTERTRFQVFWAPCSRMSVV